jgi:hypothetical protein
MRKNISTVVEITDTHIKLLQARHARGQRVICTCEFKELPESTDEGIVKGLKDMIPRAAYPFKEVVAVIPRRFVILKQMRLPSHHDREIRKMISLQMAGQIPYPPDAVVYDYLFLEKEPSGYSRVLVVIVHKDVSGRYLRIFKEGGVSSKEFVLSSAGLLGWLVYQQSKKKFGGGGAVLLVNMDAAHVELCFCHNGRLLFSRILLCGAKDWGADNMEGVIHQIELTWKNYHQENMGPALAKGVILSTEGDGLSLKKGLEEKLKISFEIACASDDIPFQKNINPSGFKERGAPSLAAGLGVLLSDSKDALNLIPKEISAMRGTRLKNAQRIKIVFLSALILAIGLAMGVSRIYKKMMYLRDLEARSARIGPGVKAAKQKIRLVKFFEEELNKRPVLSGVIYELIHLMPEDVSLRSIYLDGFGRVSVQGYAQAGTSVNNFQAGLVKSPVFKEVNLEYATKRKIFNMEVTDFKISFKSSNVKEGE